MPGNDGELVHAEKRHAGNQPDVARGLSVLLGAGQKEYSKLRYILWL
jgi:hypothetical protein